MKNCCLLLGVILLAGCAGTQRTGISRYDDYDAVKIDQMVGNNVSSAIFERTLVCLNARRESRLVTALTNASITSVTNRTVQALTNQTVSMATNYLVTMMTNLAPPAPVLPSAGQPAGDAAANAPVETNTLVIVTNSGPSVTTNLSVSVARNQSSTASPNQVAANNQLVRTFNQQITTTSNNLSIAVMTNQVITAETNDVISYVTNYQVFSVTNVVVAATNFLAHDYFLYTELTPPPDFTLQTGESLVLLVDGTRYSFVQSQSGTAFAGRPGFTSGLYRVSPEVLVAIANAKEVRIRFKGVSSSIERTMSAGSRQNFRAFLLKYFSPERPPPANAAFVPPSVQIAVR